MNNIRARGLEIGRIFDILRRHRIQARSHMTMMNLLMTAEGLGKRLAPELSLTDAALPIWRRPWRRRLPDRSRRRDGNHDPPVSRIPCSSSLRERSRSARPASSSGLPRWSTR